MILPFCLYGDLVSRGELSQAAEYARQLGVPAKDAGAILAAVWGLIIFKTKTQ